MSDRTVSETAQPQPFTPEYVLRIVVGSINRYFARPGMIDDPVTAADLAAVAQAGTAFAELTRLINEQAECQEIHELKSQLDRLEKQLLMVVSSGGRNVA